MSREREEAQASREARGVERLAPTRDRGRIDADDNLAEVLELSRVSVEQLVDEELQVA